jgi:hypothetical protein
VNERVIIGRREKFTFDMNNPKFRKVFEKRYYSCHCESRVRVSFFRHEKAHAPLLANGEDGVPLMAEPPGSSVKTMHSRLPSSLPEKGHPYPGLGLAKFGIIVSDRIYPSTIFQSYGAGRIDWVI